MNKCKLKEKSKPPYAFGDGAKQQKCEAISLQESEAVSRSIQDLPYYIRDVEYEPLKELDAIEVEKAICYFAYKITEYMDTTNKIEWFDAIKNVNVVIKWYNEQLKER